MMQADVVLPLLLHYRKSKSWGFSDAYERVSNFVCCKNANVSTTWRKYGDKARLSHRSSSPEVPRDSMHDWNKAGEKRQITSFKVPLRDWWLGRYSYRKEKKEKKKGNWGATKASSLPQHVPNCGSLSSPFFVPQPSPHFPSPYPAIPLITTFWLPLPSLLRRPGWANIAHFSREEGDETHGHPLQAVQKPQESVTEDLRHRLINFHSSSNKALLCLKAWEQMRESSSAEKDRRYETENIITVRKKRFGCFKLAKKAGRRGDKVPVSALVWPHDFALPLVSPREGSNRGGS